MNCARHRDSARGLPIGVYSINPALFKDLPYDPARDMDLLTLAVRTPNVLVASPKFPANTVAELIAHMKKNSGQVSFVSSGTGSSDHLTAVLFWQKTGTSGVHVPYKGGAPKEFADFQAGEVQRWKDVIEKGNIKPES